MFLQFRTINVKIKNGVDGIFTKLHTPSGRYPSLGKGSLGLRGHMLAILS